MNKKLLKLGFPKIKKSDYPSWKYMIGYTDGRYWTLCNDLWSAIKIWFKYLL